MDIINKLYNYEDIILYSSFEKINNNFNILIQNHNTIFKCSFIINRYDFTNILNTKYKHIINAKFEPSNYQGINAKYLSKISCESKDNCELIGKKYSCGCKEITFLIFQEGTIIITGGRKWEQIIDGYNILKTIIRNEFDNIKIEKNIKNNYKSIKYDKKLPDIIRKYENSNKIVYINKKI